MPNTIQPSAASHTQTITWLARRYVNNDLAAPHTPTTNYKTHNNQSDNKGEEDDVDVDVDKVNS